LTSTGFFFPLKFLLLHSEANWVSLSTQIVLVGGRKSELASQYFSMALSTSVQWLSVDPFAILIMSYFVFCSTPFELHDDAYVLKALSLQEHQGAKSTEVMGRRGFDDGLGCKFEEDSSPLSSIFQHSSFPPCTSPYYPVSMPSVAKGSLGMLQVSSSRVKQENLS
jgi:hypothetical protein